MPDLTPAQRARLLDAVTRMDPQAWAELPDDPQWTQFYYDGYLTLEGLLEVAAVLRGILAEQTLAAYKARQPPSPAPQ